MQKKVPLAGRRTLAGTSTLVVHLFVLVAFFVLVLGAVVSPHSNASSVAEDSYSQESVSEGSLVSISPSNPSDVELANINNVSYLYGVVQKQGQSLLQLAKSDSQVTIATSGEVYAFVSDVNGDIKQGDLISASWIDGVGMRATQMTTQKLLGVALKDFSEIQTRDYDGLDLSGDRTSAKIGALPVRIVASNFEGQSSDETLLQKIGGSLAGKEVSLTKVLISFAVFVVSLAICAFFITSAIRGSFLSIGRNPLASSSIYSSLIQVSTASIVIVLIGTALSYAVLMV